jgi:hypothetical protein
VGADKIKFPKHILREIILPNPWKIFYTNQMWILTPRKSHAHFKRREERRELLLLYLLGFCFTFL